MNLNAEQWKLVLLVVMCRSQSSAVMQSFTSVGIRQATVCQLEKIQRKYRIAESTSWKSKPAVSRMECDAIDRTNIPRFVCNNGSGKNLSSRSAETRIKWSLEDQKPSKCGIQVAQYTDVHPEKCVPERSETVLQRHQSGSVEWPNEQLPLQDWR